MGIFEKNNTNCVEELREFFKTSDVEAIRKMLRENLASLNSCLYMNKNNFNEVKELLATIIKSLLMVNPSRAAELTEKFTTCLNEINAFYSDMMEAINYNTFCFLGGLR